MAYVCVCLVCALAWVFGYVCVCACMCVRPGCTKQSLDLSKPTWRLCVVCDQSKAESLEMKKDTERLNKIRAIKEAWETAEPGRHAKVATRMHI